MQKVAAAKQVVVTQAKADCEELLVEIVQDKRVADEQEKTVNMEATKIGKEADEANAIQVSAELEKALPALQEAEAALNCLTKKDISELKVGLECPWPEAIWMEYAAAQPKLLPTYTSCLIILGFMHPRLVASNLPMLLLTVAAHPLTPSQVM
jgi:hypothetical protein